MEIPKFRPPSASFRKKKQGAVTTKFILDDQDESFLLNSLHTSNVASSMNPNSSNTKLSLQEELDMIPTSEELEQQFMKLYGRLHDDRTLAEWLNLGQQSTIGEDLNAQLEVETQLERDFIRANEKLLGDDNMRQLAVNYEDGFLLDDIREDRRQRMLQEKQARREEKLKQILGGASRLVQLKKNEELKRRRSTLLANNSVNNNTTAFIDYLDYSGDLGSVSGGEESGEGELFASTNKNTNNENQIASSFIKQPATALNSWEAELALRRAAFLSGVSSTSALSRFLVRSSQGEGDDYDDDELVKIEREKKMLQEENGDDDSDDTMMMISNTNNNNNGMTKKDSFAYSSSRMMLSQTKNSTGRGSFRRLQFDDDDEEYFDAKEEERRKRKALRTQSALRSREHKARNRADDIAHGKLSGEAVWIPAEPHYFVECPRSSDDDDDDDDENIFEEEEEMDEEEDHQDKQKVSRRRKFVPPSVARLNEKCTQIQNEIANLLGFESMMSASDKKKMKNTSTNNKSSLSSDPFISKIRLLLSQARELLVVAADFAYEVEQNFWDEINQESFLSKTFRDKFFGVNSRINKNTRTGKGGIAAMKARKQENIVQAALNKNDDQNDEEIENSLRHKSRRRSTMLFHGGNTGGGKFSILGDENDDQKNKALETELSIQSFRSNDDGEETSPTANAQQQKQPQPPTSEKNPNTIVRKNSHVSFSRKIEDSDHGDDENNKQAFDADEARFLDENGKNLLTPGHGPPEGALQRIKTFVERGLYQLDIVLSKELPEARFEEFPQLSEHHQMNFKMKNGKRKIIKKKSNGDENSSSLSKTHSAIFNFGDENNTSNNNNNDNEDSDDDSDDEDLARSGKVKMKKNVRHLFGSHKNLANALREQERLKKTEQQFLPQQLGAPAPISTILNNVVTPDSSLKKDDNNKSMNTTNSSSPPSTTTTTTKNPSVPSGFNDQTYLLSAQAILNASSSPMNNGNASFAEDRRYGVVLTLISNVLDALLHTSDSNNNILQQTALEIEVIMGEMRQLVAERIEHVLARDEALGELTFAVEEIQSLFRCAARTSVHIQDETIFRGIVRTFVAASRRMQDFARDIARIGEVAMLDAKELRARLAKAKPEHEQMIVALLELADAIETQPVAVPRHAQWRRKALDELYWNLQSAIATLSTLELAGDEVADDIVNGVGVAPALHHGDSSSNNNHHTTVALHIRELIVKQKLSMEEVSAMYLKDSRTGVAERSVMKGTALAIAARRKLRETGRAMDSEWGFSCW